jgi:putative NADPH-quinone reductase
MKTLIVVIHPDLKNSVVNKRWMEELNKYPDLYKVHSLYDAYPDGELDVKAEQALVEQYDTIVFQFPFYWFNCPYLFKKWLDEVLLHGWAYGSKSGYKVAGKKIALAMSVGVDEKEYSADGKYKYTVEELTRPFALSFEYIKAEYRPFFAFYGIDVHSKANSIENSIPLYIEFLQAL